MAKLKMALCGGFVALGRRLMAAACSVIWGRDSKVSVLPGVDPFGPDRLAMIHWM